MESTITHALKEWAIAVEALEQGQTILLLRKGGISEQSGRFSVDRERVLLYPTYEHQRPDLLKPDYTDELPSVQAGATPETVRISSWAEITDIFLVAHEPAIEALLPYHIWNEQFASDRLNWKRRQPLSVLLLRTYKLPQAQLISYRQEYGGCKSWISLLEPISIEGSAPVLSDAEYVKQATAIRRSIANPEAV